jgi:hypothetical protein
MARDREDLGAGIVGPAEARVKPSFIPVEMTVGAASKG